ncbi:four helix bundle protein [Mariniphaga sediminis]|jgi:four helix bundle protein|uniref:Four helix bundle protein n=1 Tax=Mariniphaga sediminis TaxID=1628158 RepID=A0A399D5U8_9BACT|nr:four helix bundle protein [Mariniphaga sediminis]RIH67264.1 four helix bundle protein [Mariniphaga sediminis]
MGSYKDLDIYKIAFELSLKVHKLSLELPHFELYEQGAQVRRSSKSIKDQIVEGYGRRRYKADFTKFLIYAQASNDECANQIKTIVALYPDKKGWNELAEGYEILGMKIYKFIQYVEKSWKT